MMHKDSVATFCLKNNTNCEHHGCLGDRIGTSCKTTFIEM